MKSLPIAQCCSRTDFFFRDMLSIGEGDSAVLPGEFSPKSSSGRKRHQMGLSSPACTYTTIRRPSVPDEIANPVPDHLARAVDAAVPVLQSLGHAEDDRVFLTAAEDVEGLDAESLWRRLGVDPAPSFYLITFPTSSLEGPLTSPFRDEAQCFIGGGRTRGGAREFTAKNQRIPSDAQITVIS